MITSPFYLLNPEKHESLVMLALRNNGIKTILLKEISSGEFDNLSLQQVRNNIIIQALFRKYIPTDCHIFANDLDLLFPDKVKRKPTENCR